MIRYTLKCKDCFFEFDSWFSSSKEFDRLKKLKFINCETCNSIKVEKSLMTPNLSNAKKKTKDKIDPKIQEVKKKIKDYQNFIKKNFEYVGDNFSYEARSLHYNEKKTKNGIYGKASLEDVKELKEEGIETEIIPWIKDKEN